MTLYEKILEGLGVKENEKFIIIDENGIEHQNNPFCFVNGYLKNKFGYEQYDEIHSLLIGEYKIKKEWKPKDGDVVWYVDMCNYINKVNFCSHSTSHLATLKCGWLFKSYDEANQNKERVLAEMIEVLK